MSIEKVVGATVITGDDVHKYRIVTLKHAMKLELIGMARRGRSVYAILKSEFGLKGNKQRVYEQFCDMHGMER